MTIFRPDFIVGAIAYGVTNMLINNSLHGWYGVLAAGVVGGLVAGISYGKKGE